jgi:hypothetical protein
MVKARKVAGGKGAAKADVYIHRFSIVHHLVVSIRTGPMINLASCAVHRMMPKVCSVCTGAYWINNKLP